MSRPVNGAHRHRRPALGRSCRGGGNGAADPPMTRWTRGSGQSWQALSLLSALRGGPVARLRSAIHNVIVPDRMEEPEADTMQRWKRCSPQHRNGSARTPPDAHRAVPTPTDSLRSRHIGLALVGRRFTGVAAARFSRLMDALGPQHCGSRIQPPRTGARHPGLR